MYAAILDDDGLPRTDLGPGDFELFEDGEARNIELVLAPRRTGLSLTLVADFSASVSRDFPAHRKMLAEFLDQLSPSDCVFLLPFGTSVGPGLRDRADSTALREVVADRPIESGTHLYDAVAGGLSGARVGLDECPEASRSAIVLMTDGIDEGSMSQYADVLVEAWRTQVPILAVAVGAAGVDLRRAHRRQSRSFLDSQPAFRSSMMPSSMVEQVRVLQSQLDELARVSGGRVVTQRDLSSGLSEVLGLLRGYYALAYGPAISVPGWHEIQIKTSVRGVRVIAQPGYYIAPPDAGGQLSEVHDEALGHAAAAFLQSRYEVSREAYTEAAAANPVVGDPHFGLGLAFEAMEDWPAAEAAFREALSWRPGTPPAHAKLGASLLRLGQTAAGERHLLRALRGGLPIERLGTPVDASALARRYAELAAAPVLFLRKPDVPDLMTQLDLLELSRDIGRFLNASTELVFTAWKQPGALAVRLAVERYVPSTGDLEAKLELLDAEGEHLLSEALSVDDVRESAQTRAAAAEAVDRLVASLADSER